MMEIHWDWQDWLRRGIPDEVTLKALNPDSFRTHFGRDVIARCHARRIPVYLSAFVHAGGVLGRKDWKRYLGQAVRSSGLDGFIVYEHSFLFVAHDDGRIVDINPEFTAYLRERNRRH